jgi:hypothetical protein
MTRQCERCKRNILEFENIGKGRTKYCIDCKEEVVLEQQRQQKKRSYARKKALKDAKKIL